MDYIMLMITIKHIIIPIIAGISLFLGYKLFIKGVSGSASLKLEQVRSKIQLLNAAPGLFFALFGMVILVASINASLEYSSKSNYPLYNKESDIIIVPLEEAACPEYYNLVKLLETSHFVACDTIVNELNGAIQIILRKKEKYPLLLKESTLMGSMEWDLDKLPVLKEGTLMGSMEWNLDKLPEYRIYLNKQDSLSARARIILHF